MEKTVSMTVFRPRLLGPEQESGTRWLCLLPGRNRASTHKAMPSLSSFSLLSLSPSCLLGDREQKAIVSPLHVSWGREGDFQGMECCHGNNLSPGIA